MNNLFDETIRTLTEQLCAHLQTLPLAERIVALNTVRGELHAISPFRDEPVDFVAWIPAEHVHANTYNPNHVAAPELRLLERSIRADGYTQPIVAAPREDGGMEVVDGFHRSKIGKEKTPIRNRVYGYLPITTIKAERSDQKNRMAATIRHNRARGVHGVMPMASIVASLIREGWTDSEIAAELGMDADEVLRMKQTTGIAALFKNHTYSRSWD